MREQHEQYEFGRFRLDVGEHRLEHLDEAINGSLPEKAFLTLVHLVRNSAGLVTKEELLLAVWPDTVVEENNLGKAIHAVRHFLGETAAQKYIETVPKHGYRFVAPVTRLSAVNGSNNGDNLSQTRPRAQFKREPLRSPAYDLYLRGRVKADSENREDVEAAVKVLEAAVAIDPDLAGAYAQLARAYNTLAFKFSSNTKAKLVHENAEVAILKALTLDPDLAEGHFARGLILWTKAKGFPHEQAIQSYKRSVELDPNSDETHHQLSMVYSHIGLLDEAQATVRRALEINPNNTMARFRACVYTAYQGRFDEAVERFATIPREVSPLLVDRCLADVLIQLGRLSEAEAIAKNYLRNYPQDEGGSFTSVKALLSAKAGKEKDAKREIERAITIGSGYGHFHHTAHNIAGAYAAMDMPDQAVKWLATAAAGGFPNYPYFEIDPNLDPLREHASFIAFMSKLRNQRLRFKALP